MKITLLGTGASLGVPVIGCKCNTCISPNPKNNRTRSSIFIEVDNQNILIDASPDLRTQALHNNISRIDSVIFTHAHADHIHGIDDLRNFNHLNNSPINVYSCREYLDEIKARFDYAFLEPKPDFGWFRPCLIENEIENDSSFKINNTEFITFTQTHGRNFTTGLRIGNFAYSTDVNYLTEDALETLKGTELWIVDCLKYNKSPAHADLETTLGWIEKVKPKQAVITHMSHDFEYEKLKTELPENVVPAYDSMTLNL